MTTQYVSQNRTDDDDLVCTNATTCDYDSQYDSVLKTNFSNRECAAPSVCDLSVQYISAAPTVSSDRNCTDATICAPGQFVAINLTNATDRECGDCVEGLSFSIVENAFTCTPARVCDEETEYETAPALVDQDRECEALTNCSSEFQYTSANNTATTDRNCMTSDGGDTGRSLSAGAWVGIGISIAVVLVLTGAMVYYLRKRKRIQSRELLLESM